MANIHEFDEAQDVAAPLEKARHVDDALIIGAALHHHVDLDRLQSYPIGFLDALEHFAHRKVDVVHRPEYGVVERIQADCDALQSRVLQCLRFLFQQGGVGGQCQIKARFPGEHFNEPFQLPSHQRFASRDADLLDSMAGEHLHQAVDFVEAQQLGAFQELEVPAVHFLGHAVGAAEVAAVRHRDAQVAQRPPARIRELRRFRPGFVPGYRIGLWFRHPRVCSISGFVGRAGRRRYGMQSIIFDCE